MQPRINQGRTYRGGGNGLPPPTGPRSDRTAGSATGGGQTTTPGAGNQSSRATFLSQADLSRTVQDSGTTDPRIVPARTSNSTPAIAGFQQQLSHSEDVPGDTRKGAADSSASSANVNNADRPRGILKTTSAPTSNSATNLKASQSKLSDKAAEAAAANPLLGQTVVVHGLQYPIKALPKTLEALRAGKPWQQAFQSRDASTWLFENPADAASSESSAINNVSQLSVYFPLSIKKDKQHNPVECHKLCNGAPHVDRATICRFCLSRIAPRYKKKIVFKARECLDHLQNCPGIPKLEDRKLLYEAFRKADERHIENYHTSEWRAGIKQPEISHPKPLLPPKARPQNNSASTHRQNTATSAPMGRRTSSGSYAPPPSHRTSLGSNAPSRQVPGQASQPSYMPIAAKQLPNNIPTMPAAMRRGNPDAIAEDASSRQPSPAGSAQTDGSEWGVSTKSATYEQHIARPDTISEKNELEEPQHDPEDGFAWQAVREKLNNAPPSDGPPNNDSSMLFGAEIISEPQSAPKGQPFMTQRHVSVPPHRPESRAVYRGPDREASLASGANIESRANSRAQDASVPLPSRKARPVASVQSVAATTTSTQGDRARPGHLFRSATPPSSRHAKTETSTPNLSEEQRRAASAEMQNIPEPELPAEDPWDLMPDPTFGSFFAQQDFARSGAPSLESKAASRAMSLSPQAEATVSKSERGNKTNKEKRKMNLTPPLGNLSAMASATIEVQFNSQVNLENNEAPETKAVETPEDKQSKKERKKAKKLRKAQKAAEQEQAALEQEAEQKGREEAEQEKSKQQEEESKAQGADDETGSTVANEKGQKSKKTKKKEKNKDIDVQSALPRERSPSVEFINPVKPTSSMSNGRRASQANIGTGSQARRELSVDDEDDDVPLRTVPFGQTKPSGSRDVVDISSSDDEIEIPSKSSQQPGKYAAKNKAPLGPVAQKTMKSDRKGKYKQRASSHDMGQSDLLSSSDSDSDCVKVTSVRVLPNLSRPIPYVEVVQQNRARKPVSRGRSSAASSFNSHTKRNRAPSPSDPSESESDDEEAKEPTASQTATYARRFQRFADRDRSPEVVSEKSSKGKGKKKMNKSYEDSHAKPRIVRRRVDEEDEIPSSPVSVRQRKRKAKVIHTSDEDDEEDQEVIRGKRLKTYEERQSQLASQRHTISREGSHVSGSSSAHQSNTAASDAQRSLDYFPPNSGSFFVDVQKNVDNVLYLPAELDPWADVFQAADILNLDTLRDCIRKPENADEFVKWVLARTGRKMPLAKQFPMVQAIQQVLSNE